MSRRLSSPGVRHVVVVATVPGREHLLRRALESVGSQTRRPCRVIVVPDCDALRAASIGVAARGLLPGAEVLRNRRTPGLSGSCNSAIDHLLRTEQEPADVLVSFLDDDDTWEPGYLEHVGAAAEHAEVVVGTVVRHDAHTPDGRVHEPPDALNVEAFLVGNPYVQGSNLSARLDSLLLAGGFDEALKSCTDRDLAIRLLDLGASYRAAPAARAHHDTLHGCARLSDPGATKREALDVFFSKYRARMTPAQQEAFAERARALFGWSRTPTRAVPTVTAAVAPVTPSRAVGGFSLVAGVVVDGNLPRRVLPLLDGLARLATHSAVTRFEVVLLENGASEGFDAALDHARAAGLTVWPVRLPDQERVASNIGLLPGDVTRSKAIAVSRTLLQRFVHEVASQYADTVAWILDDDVRPPTDANLWADAVLRARGAGFDVVIGTISGAPPVPPASTLRTQLVDVHALMVAARVQGPTEALPSHEATNARWRSGRRDYYYDLTRMQTDRLETPFAPPLHATSVGEGVRELAERLQRILAGEAVTRPVELVTGDIVHDARDSRLRGGNTLIFSLDLLRDVSNLAPRVSGRPVRRSDMLWAANASLRLNRKVVAAPFDVVQDRSADAVEDQPARRLLDDILGYAFFRAYEEVLTEGARGRGPLSATQRAEVLRRARKNATERFAAFRLAFWRSRGLAIGLRRCVEDGTGWVESFAGPDAARSVQRFLDDLDRRLAPGVLAEIERAFDAAMDDNGFAAYLDEIDAQLARNKVDDDADLTAWCKEARLERAARLLRHHAGCDVDERLGSGAEGAVFRVASRVFKVFDRWSAAERIVHSPTLRELAARPRIASLPRVVAVHDWSGATVLETEWEESEPYTGGRGPELAKALRGLIEAGFVHTNLAPKNLRVTHHGIQIIDLGRSLERATEAGVAAMARRAFLGWRFAFRPDLPSLARRPSDDFPELVGWRGLLDAVRTSSPKDALDRDIALAVREGDPSSVLDFGCGKPRPGSIVGTRAGWVGFDPDPAVAARWVATDRASSFCHANAFAAEVEHGAPFDTVLCSLVLCTLDDEEALAALRQIRRAVADEGRVIVAVCDPTSVHVRNTVHQHRDSSRKGRYGDSFTFEKRVEHGDTCRTEVHRPVERYRRLFASANLAVVNETTIDGVDLDRLEPVSEFLVFRLRPLPQIRRRTSLLVKVCALEAETARHQVRHLVEQLGAPRAFDEVVVACDPHRGPFPRSHGSGQLEALREALDDLVRAGWVDRVVDGPLDGDESRIVSRRWYGESVARSRAANGQPLLAVGVGIDACTGDLVLHADADVLVARPDPLHDHIAETAALFDAQPDAVTVALPVFGDTHPLPRHADERGPYRVESQVGWIHRQRLLDLLPLPNPVHEGTLQLPWHRALDQVVRSGAVKSIRRGSPALWFTSPDNARKRDPGELFLLMDRVEAGWAPPAQRGRSATVGTREAWVGPKRTEEVVVVVCGRNVGAGRVRRCLSSLATQTFRDWGLIVVDDASDDGTFEVLRRCLGDLPTATLIRRRKSVGALANTAVAIRDLIARPDAVVVLLDLDDALGRTDALAKVVEEHRCGADVTVGTMVRTDRHVAYEVDFSDPRGRRGGNVWQHLRTFRKSLFDRVDPADLKLDGEHIDLASDWAFMIPIVEMAERPEWIREPLYLHEPGEPRTPERRAARESVIARILARPRYPRSGAGDLSRLTVLAYHRVLPGSAQDAVSDIYRRRGMVVSVETFRAQMRALASRFTPVSLVDVARAACGDIVLPPDPVLVTFDDGYSDFRRHAAAYLQELGIPVALFARLPLADDRPSWAPLDFIYHGLGTARPTAIGAPEIHLAAREHLLGLPSAEQHALARAAAAHLGEEEIEAIRADLYLSGTEIRALAARGVHIGAHGAEHVRWTGLTDGALRDTLRKCRSWHESMHQQAVAVSYPDGSVDERVARATAEEGFSLGFALTEHPSELPENMAVRRLVAVDDPFWVDSLLCAPEAAE